MRVDDCQLCALSFGLGGGDVFAVEFRLQLADGWGAEYASGEFLDAFDLRNPAVGAAAVGMRDPAWVGERFDLDVIEASDPKVGGNVTTARYRARRAIHIDIQSAIAWTHHPTTDKEAISPWFAVDKAMTF